MTDEVEAVIDRVLGGDIDAYVGIVRRYQGEVWRIVAFALRDVAATEDLVQQVFVSAYLNLARYEAGRDFGAWLRSMARNLVRKEVRRSLREDGRLRLYRESLMERLAKGEEAEAYEAGLREALAECREGLSPSAKLSLELRYGRAMGFEGIAEALGRTVAATRQMLSRVRLALRRCIEERMSRA